MEGRKVVVIAADPGWEHTQYIDDQARIWHLNLASMRAHPAQKPRYGGPSLVFTIGDSNEALVIHERFMGKDTGVEIVVSNREIDEDTVQVATDALLQQDRRAAVEVCAGCGATAGICMAMAEAHASTRTKGAIGKTTNKRSAAQLDREIAAVLGKRR